MEVVKAVNQVVKSRARRQQRPHVNRAVLTLADDAVVIGHDIAQVAQAPGLIGADVESPGFGGDLCGIGLCAGGQDKSEGGEGDFDGAHG